MHTKEWTWFSCLGLKCTHFVSHSSSRFMQLAPLLREHRLIFLYGLMLLLCVSLKLSSNSLPQKLWLSAQQLNSMYQSVYSTDLLSLSKQTGVVLKITNSICLALSLNVSHDSKVKGTEKGFKLFSNFAFPQRDFYVSILSLNKHTHTQWRLGFVKKPWL